MKFFILIIPFCVLAFGLVTLLSSSPVNASGGSCNLPDMGGWHYGITRTAATCSQAKATLNSYLNNLAHQSCGDLVWYNIDIDPNCTTNECGQQVATGDLTMCCREP